MADICSNTDNVLGSTEFVLTKKDNSLKLTDSSVVSQESEICKTFEQPEIQANDPPLTEENEVKLAQHSKKFCLFVTEGCNFIGVENSPEMLEHPSLCEFRHLPCIFVGEDGCEDQALKLSAYKEHLISVHGIETFWKQNLTQKYFIPEEILARGDILFKPPSDAADEDYYKKSPMWKALLDFGGETFLIVMFARANIMYWTVFCLNVMSIAHQFGGQIAITYTNPMARRGQFRETWRIPIRPVRTGFSHYEKLGEVTPCCGLGAVKSIITSNYIHSTAPRCEKALFVSYRLFKHKTSKFTNSPGPVENFNL